MHTLDLLFEVLTRARWMKCLAAPLGRAAAKGNILAQQLDGAGVEMGQLVTAGLMEIEGVRRSGREALRGREVHALDFIFDILTSEEWAKCLQAPLGRAAAKGNRDLAQQLVGAGAEIGDALHWAIHGRHGEIVTDLLESGASLTAKDAEGCTPLHAAAVQGETGMVQRFLLDGADKDALGDREWTPLYLATRGGHVGATLALLAAGADVNL